MPDMVDAIVVGSGAGGAAAAYRLVKRGLSVLMLEKGGRLPRDGSTLSVREVFKLGKFKSKEPWHDGRGQSFVPSEFYNVGGKTKWYGAALLRFSPHEFRADPAHRCLAWPFGHEEMAPYYDEAERLLHVNRFDNEPELQRLVDRICRQDPSWRSEPLPLGLKREILENVEEAKHFDGFASVAGFKADAERDLIERIAGRPELQAARQEEGGRPPARRGPAGAGRGRGLPGRQLLPRQARDPGRGRHDLAAHPPGPHEATGLRRAPALRAARSGANFKLHINSALLAFSPFSHHDVLRKTAIFLNDAHPHTTVQCLGWLDGDLLATQLPAAVPKFLTNAAGAHAYGFFVTTEDGSIPGEPGDLRPRRHADARLRPGPAS